ncbi:unnamed protein product [Sphagnum jensenii]|uniref:Uncharacterized protein n=1 Tax=Sphagnum jensenii TaxID=128206 RepID=A0ABP0VEP4_9BRYO
MRAVNQVFIRYFADYFPMGYGAGRTGPNSGSSTFRDPPPSQAIYEDSKIPRTPSAPPPLTRLMPVHVPHASGTLLTEERAHRASDYGRADTCIACGRDTRYVWDAVFLTAITTISA